MMGMGRRWCPTNPTYDLRHRLFISAFVIRASEFVIEHMVRIILPHHLRNLAQADREVQVDVQGEVTQRSVLAALEAKYPALLGTIRDRLTQQRRPLVRFFACEEDLSHELPDAPLPQKIGSGEEPFYIVGAIAGG